MTDERLAELEKYLNDGVFSGLPSKIIKELIAEIRRLRSVIAADRERCTKVVEETESQGDYTGRDDTGGSYWESNAELTLKSAARRIREMPI